MWSPWVNFPIFFSSLVASDFSGAAGSATTSFLASTILIYFSSKKLQLLKSIKLKERMSGRAAAATKISTALRKPSIRSLYDKQEIFTVPKACRSVKDVLIGYDAYSAGRFLRHPLQYFQNELRLPRIKEHFLIRAIN